MNNNFSRNLSMFGLKIKKYIPQMLIIAGCAGTVIGTVEACKSTLKLSDTLEDCRSRKNEIEAKYGQNEASEGISVAPLDPEVEKEYHRELTKVTFTNICDIGKLYSKAALIELASITAIGIGDFKITKSNVELAAGFATLQRAFKHYRDNVKETYGEEADRDMRFGIKHEKVEETVVDEDGKKHKVKKDVAVVDVDRPDPWSEWSVFFMDGCKGYCADDPRYNIAYLKRLEDSFNDKLRARGYVFINEIYEALGVNQTLEGNHYGWIFDLHENTENDNFIDFGLYEAVNKNERAVNGWEPVVLLDFNVDGDLYANPKLKKLLEEKMNKHYPGYDD